MLKRLFNKTEEPSVKMVEAIEKNRKASEALISSFAHTTSMTMEAFLQELHKQQKSSTHV